MEFDAVLITSFGGPESHEDVIPFLENVLRGRNVPRPRMLEVAEHYYHFGGRSPINDQNRALLAAVEAELRTAGIGLPVYWGNRNWHPLLADTLRRMRNDGVRHALAFVTSAFSSYSGCRQYLEDIVRARAEVAADNAGAAPVVDKVRVFFNHPGFIETVTQRVRDAFAAIPEARRAATRLLYTAHSVPTSMASSSSYVAELQEAGRLVSENLGRTGDDLVWQSRSGPPTQPWLEPDILTALRDLRSQGVADVVVMPLGFISDHMEVLYDLDTEAAAVCAEIGLNMVRAGTPGTHPRFVRMIRELIEERISGRLERSTVGSMAARPDTCAADCCPAPQRPAARP